MEMPSSPCRVLIADDHLLFADGVRSLLFDTSKWTVVGRAASGEEALSMLAKQEVDLLLTDISMPGISGIEVTQKAKAQYPDLKIIVLTMHSDPEIIREVMQAEAEGFILKDTEAEEFLAGIERVASGSTYYCHQAIATLMGKPALPSTQPNALDTLTPRELEILKLICQEFSTAEIGEQLFISPRTVETHRKHIMSKTNSQTLVGLIKTAFLNGLLDE